MAKVSLSKMDYVNDIHPKMIRNLFLNAEIIVNDDDFDISEYDIQAWVYLYLRKKLQNTKYTAKRESNERFDCVIRSNKSKKPRVYYEMKTYIKPHESPKMPEIKKDVLKLYKAIKGSKKKGYFILVIAKNKIRRTPNKLPQFIINHYNNDKHWIEVDGIKLRPSQKEKNGRLIVLSWEVQIAH